MVLASFLAKSGVASRRRCEQLIRQGDIYLNGTVIRKAATVVDPSEDQITYKGKLLRILPARYYLLHKPPGYHCTTNDRHADKIIYDLIPTPDGVRLFSIGRLDKNSEGLLLITNDGEFANLIAHPRYNIVKTYIVEVSGHVNSKDLHILSNGIYDDGELLKPLSIRIVKKSKTKSKLEIKLNDGRKREIRRMCAFLNYKVIRILRTAIGPIKLGGFKPGFYRELTKSEVKKLCSTAKAAKSQ